MKSIYPESRPDSDRILRAIVRNDYDSVVLIDSTDTYNMMTVSGTIFWNYVLT